MKRVKISAYTLSQGWRLSQRRGFVWEAGDRAIVGAWMDALVGELLVRAGA